MINSATKDLLKKIIIKTGHGYLVTRLASFSHVSLQSTSLLNIISVGNHPQSKAGCGWYDALYQSASLEGN